MVQGSDSDYSDYFDIVQDISPLQVTVPTSSTTWAQGQQNVTISWTGGAPGTNVQLYLYQGSGQVATISSGTTNDGSYNSWDVPSGQTPGTNYRVRVVQGSDSDYSDYFDIVQHVVSPPTDISGFWRVRMHVNYEYCTGGGSCNQGHPISRYRFNWDDGTTSPWSSLACALHSWNEPADRTVKAQAQCSGGQDSPWSDVSLTVKVDDRFEENDTMATATDINGYEGEVFQELRTLDDDWYYVYIVTGEGRIRIWCNFTHAQGDIDIYLYNSTGTLLCSSTGVVNNEYVDCDVPQCFTRCDYYLQVVPYPSSSEHGNWYSLRYETVYKATGQQ